MSIELVETEIRKFLSTPESDVICLSGRWGVGKTFAWNRYLRGAQSKGKIALKRYSYVSLFGIDSLAELKYSIFENSVRSSDIGVEPSLETLQSNTVAVAERLGRKGLWFIQQLPRVKNYVGGLGPVWFLSVKETIVCIDDIERRGRNLSVRDVLGLVSTLKEQKKCKVALILNDEALEDEAEFRKYYEKVVDTSLTFAPSPEECARIALSDDTKSRKLLAENCVTLGISNIRLIKKIERSVLGIESMLAQFDEQVLRQAIQSLTLFGWSIYEPSSAPPLDYLKARGAAYFGIAKKAVSEREAAWNALLSVYEFSGTDELDLVLLDGIQNGFFDPSLVQKHASALNDKIKATKLDRSFLDAWEMYHDSFEDNQDEVLDAMYQSFFKAVRYITPVNMSSTVSMFKALGRSEQAAEMIRHYVTSRGENRELFDLRNYPFSSDVTDPDVVQAFQDKYTTFRNAGNATTTLLRMAHSNGWNPEDITTLCTLPVDDYYQIFKSHRGDDLRKIIKVCLQFDVIGNATPDMKEISKRAKDALKRIGQESAINARRVKYYGVEVKGTGPTV